MNIKEIFFKFTFTKLLKPILKLFVGIHLKKIDHVDCLKFQEKFSLGLPNMAYPLNMAKCGGSMAKCCFGNHDLLRPL